jgi:EAL domain-containing protein (putative c-di-GMP-specific phosphodiesterase class I)
MSRMPDPEAQLDEAALDAPAGVRSWAEHTAQISASLREAGAIGVILVDAGSLECLERRYGVQAYRSARQKLCDLVRESCEELIHEADRIATCSGEGSADQVVVLLFRPWQGSNFYRDDLPRIAERVAERLAEQGSRCVYPYLRESPLLPVGHGFSLFNPGLREVRQVREAIQRARADADLNARIDGRTRSRRFTDLLLSEDVTILYEPIMNVTTREIRGYEGLARGPWDSELHSPNALFGMAEETGLLFELDCLCRRLALRGARGLQPGKLLFLNCLPTAIHDPGFRGDVLRRTLEDLRLRPSDVVFEISERESIHNFDIFREARDYYAELGFKIALDDTGVAYGSLEAVMELSPDFIKVDQSLVRGIDTDPPRQELLRALNAVAGKLKAEIIAEGIETSEELATIQTLGIPYGQGYLFGRAAPLRRSV